MALVLAPAAHGGEPVLLGDGFLEIVNPEVKVGGVYLVGLLRGSSPQAPNAERVYVWLPSGRFANLCVQVRSLDGVYRAEAAFDIRQTGAGEYALGFRSSKADIVRSYLAGELVLDGRVGEDCGKPETLTHVPMAWSREDAAEGLVFFVNTDGHDGTLQLPARDDAERIVSVECASVPSSRPPRVFTAACKLADPRAVDLASGWLELRRYGQVIAWEDLSVLADGR